MHFPTENGTASAKRAIDHDALGELLAHWTRRLDIEGELMDEEDFVADAPGALTAAVVGLVGESDLRDARLDFIAGDLIACGASIAVTLFNDPLGDPRDEIIDALQTLSRLLARHAQYNRDNEAIEARQQGNPGAVPPVPVLGSV